MIVDAEISNEIKPVAHCEVRHSGLSEPVETMACFVLCRAEGYGRMCPIGAAQERVTSAVQHKGIVHSIGVCSFKSFRAIADFKGQQMSKEGVDRRGKIQTRQALGTLLSIKWFVMPN